MSAFYAEDLAYVHHVGFSDFTEGVAPAVLDVFQQKGCTSGHILDLGCGSGTWAKHLTDAGYDVLGVDVSPAMIALAREVAPAATFLCASFHEVDLPACQAVTILGEGLNYLVSATKPVAPFFDRIAAVLPTGGLLLFDVIVQDRTPPMQYRHWKQGSDWAILADVKENETQTQLTRTITIFREIAGQYRRSSEVHTVQVFNADQLVHLLERSGFAVQTAAHYGPYALAPRRRAFIAEKR